MPNDLPRIAAFLDETRQLLGQLDREAIASAKRILLECHQQAGRIYTMGNGGSASTAQHFACDLAKYVIPAGQRPFDVRCLTDNMPLYTAWANDAEREEVFANQMRGLLT
ncbi:MAG TPA: SIS domain-containing protein, partial [Chthoniobacteraceae bacterium]|nr:SIS domain-containing protein [Chthoniobacteraceae bacterium]